MVDFVQRCSTDPHRSPAVVKAVIGLLGDMGHSFGVRLQAVLVQPYVGQLLQEGSTMDDSTRQLVQWTQSVRFILFGYLTFCV